MPILRFLSGVIKGLSTPAEDRSSRKRAASDETVANELLAHRPSKRIKLDLPEDKPNIRQEAEIDPLFNSVTRNLLCASVNSRTRLSSEPLPSTSASARKKSRFVEHFDSLKRNDAAKIAELEEQVDSLKRELHVKHVHFAMTPSPVSHRIQSDWTPVNRPIAPLPPRTSSSTAPPTGKPIDDWESAIQAARSKLKETPPPQSGVAPSTKISWSSRTTAMSHVPGAAMDKFLSEMKTIKLRKVAKMGNKQASTSTTASASRSKLKFSLRKKASQSSLAAATGSEQPIDDWSATAFTFKAPSPVSALFASKQKSRQTTSLGRAVTTDGQTAVSVAASAHPAANALRLPSINFGEALSTAFDSPTASRTTSGRHSIIPGAYDSLPDLMAAQEQEQEQEQALPDPPSDISSIPFPRLDPLLSSSPQRPAVVEPVAAGLGIGSRKRSSEVLRMEVSKPITPRQQSLKRKRLSDASVSSVEEKENEGREIKMEEDDSAVGKEKMAPLVDSQAQ